MIKYDSKFEDHIVEVTFLNSTYNLSDQANLNHIRIGVSLEGLKIEDKNRV